MDKKNENLIEFMKCKKNPLYFIYNYVKIEEGSGSVLYTKEMMNPKMRRVVKSIFKYHKCIFMASRQLGKSTIAAALIVWAANFYPNTKCVIVNMTQNAGKQNLNKIKFIHENLPSFLKIKLRTKSQLVKELRLSNGSEISVFFPSTVIGPDKLARSMTAPILYIDETAFISNMSKIWRAAQPVLSRARSQAIKNNTPYFILMTSTPNGMYGDGKFFYDMWNNCLDSDLLFNGDTFVENSDDIVYKKKHNGYVKVEYHWYEDPSKDEKWYEEQLKDLNFDKKALNIELNLVFTGSTGCIFDDDFLENLTPSKPKESIMIKNVVNLDLYDTIGDDDYYLIGIDTARTLTGDNAAIEIYRYSDFTQVGECKDKFGSITLFSDVVSEVVKLIAQRSKNKIILCIENTGIGGGTIDILLAKEDFDYGNYIYRAGRNKEFGISTTQESRDIMISNFFELISKNPEKIKSKDLTQELSIIERGTNNKIQAQKKMKDDLFMASCFCAYIRTLSLLYYLPKLKMTENEASKESINMFLNIFSTGDVIINKKILTREDDDEYNFKVKKHYGY